LFVLAGLAAYFHLRYGARWAPAGLLLAAGLAVLVNTSYLAFSISRDGWVEAFRHKLESTLLLATLIALVGLITFVSRALRGVDGFLFLSAAIVQIGAFSVLGRSPTEREYQPWFISHSLAFQ